MEISWRIRMNKHSSAMIHGHSALKKLTKILHVVVLHSSPCIGEETTIRCFIRELPLLHRPNNKACPRCICSVTAVLYDGANKNIRAQQYMFILETNISACGLA